MYGYVGPCRYMYGYVGLCRCMYGYVGLCRCVYGYIGNIIIQIGQRIYSWRLGAIPVFNAMCLIDLPPF